MTVLFSDVSGYTSLSEALDAEDVRAVVNDVFARAAHIVVAFGGRVEKVMGDAVLAVFGDPVAREDDAERAVRAALAIHSSVAELGHESKLGRTLSMHSGINTGVVVTGELDISGATTGPTGDAVNVAARIQALASADEILIGPDTARLVRGTFELEDAGSHTLKGRSRTVAVTRVLGVATVPQPQAELRGAFVGRSRELDTMCAAAASLRKGQPGAILLVAHPGVGKSRLVAEFRHRLDGQFRCLAGRATALGENTPYAPVIDLLSAELNIADRDPLELVGDKVRAGLRELGDDHDVLRPFEHLYGVDGEAQRADRETFPERLLTAVRMVLASLARGGPLVLIVEDLHWADTASIRLLEQVLAPGDLPILALLTSRPERSLNLPGASVLTLSELDAHDTGDLLASLLPGGAVPERVRQFAVDHTEGNPFFVEELTTSLLESGTLRIVDGEWELTEPLTTSVPSTVRGVLAARIDRLTDNERTVVREAAVIGRDFSDRVLREISELNGALDRTLGALRKADIIRLRSDGPDLQFSFKHALTQEVAYSGLPRGLRRRLHGLVASAIEREFPDRRSDLVEVLAHHYSEAEMVDEAVSCLIEAGRKSVDRYALTEADRFLSQGQTLLLDRERSPRRGRMLIDLVNTWSFVHYYQGTIDDWVALLRSHLSVAEHVDDLNVRCLYFACLGNALWFHGDARGSLEALDRALALQPDGGDSDGARHARAWRAHTLMMLGRLAEAEATDVPVGTLTYPAFKGMAGVAIAGVLAGHLTPARAVIDELLRLGTSAGNPRAEAIGCVAECAWRWVVLDAAAGESAARGLAVARDDIYRASNAFPLALALITSGQYAEARAVTEEWLQKMRAVGNYWIAAALEVMQSAADVALGRMSAGMRDLVRLEAELRERGYLFIALTARMSIARIHVLVARKAVDVKPSWLLRNPSFVVRHALPAARRAEHELAALRDELMATGFHGFLTLVDLWQAELFVATGQAHRARVPLAEVRELLADAGVEPESSAALMAVETEVVARTG